MRARFAPLGGAAVVLLAIELLDEFAFGARSAALPAISDELDLSYAEIGVLLAVPNLASGLFEPVVGILGDAWSRRGVIVGGGVLYAVAFALAAASGSFLPLLAAFVLAYPASGAFVSLSQATLMDLEPDRREQNMVRWTVVGSAGALVGPLAVGAFVLLGGGWRAAFAAVAGLALALAVAARLAPTVPRAREASVRSTVAEALRALRTRAVARWLTLLLASDLMLDVFVAFVALYLADEAGLSAGAAALSVSVWVAADLVGNAVVLRLLGRTTGTRWLRWSAVVGGLLFAAFLLVPTAPAKLAVLALLGVATAGWYPLLKAQLYGELPGRSGIAMALSGVIDPVAILPPLAVGLVADRYGLDVALWLLLLAPFALLALVPRARET